MTTDEMATGGMATGGDGDRRDGGSMSGTRKLIMWVAAIVVVGATVAATVFIRPHTRPMSLGGAVIRQDADPKKELPLADVEIKAIANDSVIGESKSDASGLFTIALRNRLLHRTRGHAAIPPCRLSAARPARIHRRQGVRGSHGAGPS